MLPENFMYAIIKSDNDIERNSALRKIIHRRHHPDDYSKENKQIPKINFNADSWFKLIDLNDHQNMFRVLKSLSFSF